MTQNQLLILAAGKGTRMKSIGPKVLVPLNRKPLLRHILDSTAPLFPQPIIIIGYKGELIIRATKAKYDYVWQRKQLGTGHAIKVARSKLNKQDYSSIVIIPGDDPLISLSSIRSLIKTQQKNQAAVAVLTVKIKAEDELMTHFDHFGRILRSKNGKIVRIIEFKDASDDQKNIGEFNLSCYCFNAKWLWDNIGALKNNNKAKEYYLTDMIALAVDQKKKVVSAYAKNPIEGLGVNTIEQLKIVKNYLKACQK
ncbi:MAG: NTP transferase domain-containing protein [Candidatus Falkowbacteria bacterium]